MSDNSLTPRVLFAEPASLEEMNQSDAMDAGCVNTDLLWLDEQQAEQYSQNLRGQPLAREVQTLTAAKVYWSIRTRPQEMVPMLQQPSFLTMCNKLATTEPTADIVAQRDCWEHPSGMTVWLEMVDDADQLRRGPGAMATQAKYKMIFNLKHGLLVAQFTMQPRDIIRGNHPGWNEETIGHRAPLPDTVSDLLATMWNHLHGLGSTNLFPNMGLGAQRLVTMTKRLRYIVLPVFEDTHYLDSFVLTCLVKLGAGTRNFSAWPGVDFKAGEL
ncbi:hypothetical protein LTR78_008017 [Recurvomyces mirabilis]|uniref:Uncharacterized protein n=1 Tax=Recurvomyces mirabilis TaxID=574656 RepID=A0AAE0WJ08_9PEZI|nr:hypothetical protein LTR78_008017 [Recurvomyces mirabilis]KAK5150745.1 hypothetical protein LTS14_009808 [Recurvomyces mirabilis]